MALADTRDSGEASLAMVLGLAMRHARENLGYGLGRIDTAIAQALVAEAAQRVGLTMGTGAHEMPESHEVAEILSIFMDDIRREAIRALGIRLN